MNTLTFYGDLQESESDEALNSIVHQLISEWQLMGSLVCNFIIFDLVAYLIDPYTTADWFGCVSLTTTD